jgi:hypothetical protein
MTQRFPDIIHVTREKDGKETYYIVHLDGVQDLAEPQPVAIYKLMSLGSVQISKRFIPANKGDAT